MSKRITIEQAIAKIERCRREANAAVRAALPIGAHVRVNGAWEGAVARYTDTGDRYVYISPFDALDPGPDDYVAKDGTILANMEHIDFVSLRAPARPRLRVHRPRVGAMRGELLDAPRQLRLTDARRAE
jgi:hypothetical protein